MVGAGVVILVFFAMVVLILNLKLRMSRMVAMIITVTLLAAVVVYLRARFPPQGNVVKALCDWLLMRW
jgi:hypothetical protein